MEAIKQSDLRFGNWFKCNGQYIILDMRMLNAFTSTIEPYVVSNLEPVTLTDDMLLDAGFKLQGSDNVWAREFPGNSEFILFDSNKSSVAIANDFPPDTYYYFYHKQARIIKYLHQLQNVVHAINDFDLIISITKIYK